ncbi:carbamate kinase [Anaerosphaera multitolerans]|uniref:Carbamate kinase n=1 Tax=Anaerosphaera multitolerans TaxID=2487351 RepID=A0A437S579_9FIRM|nr:carbamate kinase [Anaerosphaera multitolerans]RVU54154.1 carbamate kinase [Anaerosphaera multitolerans]
MAKRIVIALGGNALGDSPEKQLQLVKNTAKSIVDLIKEGHEIMIGHGNGPQVGMINLAMEYASQGNVNTPYMPFPECGAMSQGYIGYHLQQAINNELKMQNIDKICSTVITEVVVNKDDEGFSNPTKPIGAFYSKEESEKISKEKGYTFIEDSGRGYRRVVASPKPVEIVESKIIKNIIDGGNIVITVGGGGVPVIKTDLGLKGVPAVIDKDLSSAKLALELEADMLIILTAVEKVSINYNKPNQIDLSILTVEDADKYIKEGHFAKGSMLPKVEACKNFIVNSKKDSIAIITSLEKAAEAIEGKTGTIIKK